MSANSLIEVVQDAVGATGMTDVPVEDRTNLLSDNGAGYLSRSFRDYLNLVGIGHILAATEDREDLISCLRRSHKKRKQRAVGRKQKRTKIPNRVSIEDRPRSVESRRTYGHWEGDSMVSRKSTSALNSLTERKSRLIMITRINRKGAKETLDAVISRLGTLPPKFRRTLTLDNGTENTKHELITEGVGVKCYFAHSYASWERGTNENANGLVRWYFPKGTDFAKITDEKIALVESLLNNRPRKCLGFRTPIEAAASAVALRH